MKDDKWFEIWLKAERETYETSAVDPNDDYSRASTATDWTIEDFAYTDSKKCFHDSAIGVIKPKSGMQLWVIYAIYSTGDSFGIDERECFIPICFHQDKNVAEYNAAALRKKDDGDVVLVFENGKTFKFYRPWMGYFESLDALNVERMIVR